MPADPLAPYRHLDDVGERLGRLERILGPGTTVVLDGEFARVLLTQVEVDRLRAQVSLDRAAWWREVERLTASDATGERARIVAWLRSRETGHVAAGPSYWARCIEDGDDAAAACIHRVDVYGATACIRGPEPREADCAGCADWRER